MRKLLVVIALFLAGCAGIEVASYDPGEATLLAKLWKQSQDLRRACPNPEKRVAAFNAIDLEPLVAYTYKAPTPWDAIAVQALAQRLNVFDPDGPAAYCVDYAENLADLIMSDLEVINRRPR